MIIVNSLRLIVVVVQVIGDSFIAIRLSGDCIVIYQFCQLYLLAIKRLSCRNPKYRRVITVFLFVYKLYYCIYRYRGLFEDLCDPRTIYNRHTCEDLLEHNTEMNLGNTSDCAVTAYERRDYAVTSCRQS